ncbi:MAG TPA: PorV/PorQ family protein [bacterium]
MRRLILLLPFILSLLAADIGFAGGPSTAKYAGEFLSLGVGGQSLGMGGAFVAVARDVTAGYWNPAGLAFINYPEIMLMHSRQFADAENYNYASVALPVGRRSSLGLSVIRLGIDNIKKVGLSNPEIGLGEFYEDENGQLVQNRPIVLDSFGSADYAFFLTYAKRVSEGFSYGGNVKFINRSIDDNSAWGVGFDVGVMFNPTSRLIVGVNLQDITTTLLAWDTGRRELITPSLKTGVTYPITISVMGGHIQPALDFLIRFENRQENSLANLGRASMDVNMGWEYVYHNAFAIRLGFSDIGQNDVQLDFGRFTAGVGLHLPKLDIDYAFLGHEELGTTHRISARLTLEETKFKRNK